MLSFRPRRGDFRSLFASGVSCPAGRPRLTLRGTRRPRRFARSTSFDTREADQRRRRAISSLGRPVVRALTYSLATCAKTINGVSWRPRRSGASPLAARNRRGCPNPKTPRCPSTRAVQDHGQPSECASLGGRASPYTRATSSQQVGHLQGKVSVAVEQLAHVAEPQLPPQGDAHSTLRAAAGFVARPAWPCSA